MAQYVKIVVKYFTERINAVFGICKKSSEYMLYALYLQHLLKELEFLTLDCRMYPLSYSYDWYDVPNSAQEWNKLSSKQKDLWLLRIGW